MSLIASQHDKHPSYPPSLSASAKHSFIHGTGQTWEAQGGSQSRASMNHAMGVHCGWSEPDLDNKCPQLHPMAMSHFPKGSRDLPIKGLPSLSSPFVHPLFPSEAVLAVQVRQPVLTLFALGPGSFAPWVDGSFSTNTRGVAGHLLNLKHVLR